MQTGNHAGMLQSTVRIEQHGSDHADTGAPGEADQFAQPVGRHHFDVIVEEQQQIARRDRGAGVAGGGIIEAFV